MCLLIAAAVISDVVPKIEPEIHVVLLTGISCAVLILLGRDLTRVRPPHLKEACARLEHALPQRPLTALYDRPFATDNALTSALWQHHITCMKTIALSLRAHGTGPAHGRPGSVCFALHPDPGLGLSPVDNARCPLRALEGAFTPNLSLTFPGDVWMIPPDYIQAPPHHYTITDPMPPLQAFAGGTVLTVLRTPKAVEASLGSTPIPFEDLGQDRQRGRASIPLETPPVLPLILKKGLWQSADWPVTIIPDAPPTVAFHLPDAKKPTGPHPETPLLPVHILAQDDHGLTAIDMELKLPRDVTSPLQSAVRKIPLNITARSPNHLDTVYPVDMTHHPWAGLSLSMRIVARDGAQNESASPWQPVTLPERSFSHPVAATLISVRKKLALGMTAHEKLWETLETLSRSPQDFEGDLTTFLGLRIAAIRLFRPTQTLTLMMCHVSYGIWRSVWKIARSPKHGTRLSRYGATLKTASRPRTTCGKVCTVCVKRSYNFSTCSPSATVFRPLIAS